MNNLFKIIIMTTVKPNDKNSGNKKIQMFMFLLFLLNIFQISCKKLAETPTPTNQVAENNVYSTDPTAIAVFNGLYGKMNRAPFQGGPSGSISLFAGLAADEFTLNSSANYAPFINYFQNDLKQADKSSVSGAEHWPPLYNFVFICNAAIEGLKKSTTITPLVKQQLMGEAKFMRAFIYFYLVNEFGDVPLSLTTDPQVNRVLAKSSKEEIYEQIVLDLLDAEDELSSDYLDLTLLNNTTERVRPTKWAAIALLARVYLYMRDFVKAEIKATAIINNTQLFSIGLLNSVFLKNSKEAIWQIQPTDIGYNTQEGYALIIPSTGPKGSDNPVRLSNRLLKSFEQGDQRATNGNWVNTVIYKLTPTLSDTIVYPFKYKIGTSPGNNSISGLTEYFMVMRLGEQFLIRAEARAQLGNISEAQSDLNIIRNRAGLTNTNAGDKASLLAAILYERQIELFSEWGHRWFDLKRTGNVDEVMRVVTPQKANSSPWKSYQQLFPIPLADLQSNSNLIQNEGY
jgi:starch-binding outer membrane protein, SusD/RagB family